MFNFMKYIIIKIIALAYIAEQVKQENTNIT